MAATEHAEIVIIGGGIIGCSIAYHLTRMGKTDVLLLEKSGLTHGATWHAAGLVGQLRASRNLTRMLQKSVALYDTLEAETGQATDWKRVGSLRVASSPGRLTELKRSLTMAKSFGLEMHLLSAQEAQDLCPILSTDGVLAAAYLPSDGYADPASLTQALAKGARMKGARIRQGVKVTGFEKKDGRVTAVITESGSIGCDILVNAGGMWARELGLQMGVRVPSIAVEHQYLITDPIPDLPKSMPTLRDPDLRIYYKPEVRGIVIGGWEEGTLPFGENGIPPDFGQQLLPGNFERFEGLAQAAFKRTPIVETVGVRELINGPIPFSADGEYVMGKAPELDNVFVAAGFTYGIAGGGGAGAMMAEWIVQGRPSLDLWPLDIRRFGYHHTTKAFCFPRAIDLYGKYYALGYPKQEHHSARGIRRSPLYDILRSKRAVFGSRGGWERPNWFAPAEMEAEDHPSFKRANWFDIVGAEHKAVRERVALIDQTSFSKAEILGPGTLATLQHLCAADMDKPIGSVIYTQLCNERGGIEADVTFIRIEENRFYLVTGSAFATHDFHWIRSHLPRDGSVHLVDQTSGRATINLCGPQARRVLEKVAEGDVSNAAFPFATAREIAVGAAPVLAARIGYVGELGWELHVPTEYAQHLYETLWAAGEEFGIADVGYRAIDTLRMEKGYLYWSADITPDYNPFEAGLGFRVALKKPDFIGREALVRAKAESLRRKLCTFVLDQRRGFDLQVVGGECVLWDGEPVGVATSANYGHTVGKSILYAYLASENIGQAGPDNGYEIEAYGDRYKAARHEGPLYDPKMERLKS
jgi:4-methylaminobutanoate oxidase (formaldehyde-forming)